MHMQGSIYTLSVGAIKSNLSMDCFAVAHFERGKVTVQSCELSSANILSFLCRSMYMITKLNPV